MANKYETIIYEKDEEGIAIITLNRPDRRNAINPQLREELSEAVDDVRNDDDMRVLILTGAGTAFCSGFDVREQFLATDAEQRRRDQRRAMIKGERQRFLYPFGIDFYKPSIAAVNGPATGDGFAYTLSADMRIAAPTAKFSYLYVRRGLIEGEAGVHILPSLIGYSHAAEMMLTGDFVDAETALEWGLVNKIVPAEKLMEEAKAQARRFLPGAPMAQWAIKQMLYRGMTNPATLRDFQHWVSAHLWQSEDHLEGARSFAEKREPKFTGW